MQKISSYLYPNRINVVADVSLFPVRWNIVYQNRVKIYQGVDNILTLDVKNSDQKRIDISEMTLKMSITDTAGHGIVVADVVPTATTGLATISIPAGDLAILDPQFLNFAIYRENEDLTKTVFYADTQFGVKGNMELVGSVLPVTTPERYIRAFNPITDADSRPYVTTYFSDAVEVRKPNDLIPEVDESIELEFLFNKSHATVTVQFTKDDIINNSTIWTDVLGFGVLEEDTSRIATIEYPKYNRSITWMRVKFIQTTYNGRGATVDITKRYTEGGATEYLFAPNQTGKGYTVGETFTIEDERLGGGGGWTLTVVKVGGEGQVLEWLPLAEIPVSESGTFVYKDIPVSDPAKARTLDKVIVRL